MYQTLFFAYCETQIIIGWAIVLVEVIRKITERRLMKTKEKYKKIKKLNLLVKILKKLIN